MRVTNGFFILLLAIGAGRAQVLSPEEIRDPQIRALQQRYFSELKLITAAAAAHSFPYHFYFSRKLELPEKDQARNDRRSVQFDRFRGRVILKITGNYFASYSADLMNPAERARQTLEQVMLPLLKAAVPALDKTDVPEAFAFEISHHVRKRVLGVTTEAVENVVLILPKDPARRLAASADPHVQQAALVQGEVFLNAAPISVWPESEKELASPAAAPLPGRNRPISTTSPDVAASPALWKPVSPNLAAHNVAVAEPGPLAAAIPAPGRPADAIKDLQRSYQPTLDRMVQELHPQAHFVSYAPPAFMSFHKSVYLQVSLTTTLPQAAEGSQYRLAALAFDRHIAHILRPVLAYFMERTDFDGIDFSTTVRLLSSEPTGENSLAVEFLLPLNCLKTYTEFDSSGQQLLDAGFVLINGERVSLNLQVAEAGPTVR